MGAEQADPIGLEAAQNVGHAEPQPRVRTEQNFGQTCPARTDAEHEVRLAADNRLRNSLQNGGIVLAICIERHDDVRLQRGGPLEARLQGAVVTPVRRMLDDDRPGVSGLGDRVIARAVIYHHDLPVRRHGPHHASEEADSL